MADWVFYLPLLMAAAGLLTLAAGRYLPSKGAFAGTLASAYAALHSILLLKSAAEGGIELPHERIFSWFALGNFDCTAGIYIDGLSLVALFAASVSLLLAHFYCAGAGKRHGERYFAFLAFFGAGALGMVTAGTALALFIWWEIAAISLYLICELEFRSAPKSLYLWLKAGDLALLAALAFLATDVGTMRLSQLFMHLKSGGIEQGSLITISLLVFAGIALKTGQLPALLWVERASGGPVIAAVLAGGIALPLGVFAAARFYPLFLNSDSAAALLVWTGALTAIAAAIWAWAEEDLIRAMLLLCASQAALGLAAIGCGAYTEGISHFVNQLFSNTLLMMCAGIVLRLAGKRDMRHMGQLRQALPATYLSFAAGLLAFVGIPPFSGFYSKVAIACALFSESEHIYPLVLAAYAAGAFALIRIARLVFHGEGGKPENYGISEGPETLVSPAIMLGVLSLFAGWALGHNSILDRIVHNPQIPHRYSAELALPLAHFLILTFVVCALPFTLLARNSRLNRLLRQKAETLASFARTGFGMEPAARLFSRTGTEVAELANKTALAISRKGDNDAKIGVTDYIFLGALLSVFTAALFMTL